MSAILAVFHMFAWGSTGFVLTTGLRNKVNFYVACLVPLCLLIGFVAFLTRGIGNPTLRTAMLFAAIGGGLSLLPWWRWLDEHRGG